MMKPKMSLKRRIERKLSDISANSSRRKASRKMKDVIVKSSKDSGSNDKSEYKPSRKERLVDASKERRFKQKRLSSNDREQLGSGGVNVKTMTKSVPTASAKRAKRTLDRIDKRQQMKISASDAIKRAGNRSDMKTNRANTSANNRYARGMMRQGVDINAKKKGL